jgi:two-component system sensor histidine kinase KdpD
MTSGRELYLRESAKQIGIGTVGVALITALAYAWRFDFPLAGCLYLLLVVGESTFAYFGSCTVVSLIAIACLDYFFVPPLFTFGIDRPVDGLALLTFLVTALVTTRLASRAREGAQRAEARRKDLARLYDLASRLIGLSPVVAVKQEYLAVFREIFHLRAVCLFDGTAAAGQL